MEKPDPHSQQKHGGEFEDLSAQSTEDLLDTKADIDLDSIHELLAGLDKWAEEACASSDAEMEVVDKIYHSRLPIALFHATTPEKAKRIMAEGLKPSKLKFEELEVVSLSDSIAYAKFCASQTQGVEPKNLVVLEVTTQGLDRERAKSYLLLDNPLQPSEPLHEVHYDSSIAADWIHQLSWDEAARIEAEEH